MAKQTTRPGPKFTAPDERRAHLQAVARLYADGVSQTEIAKQTGVTQGSISQDIKLLHIEWRETRSTNVDKLRLEELATLDRVQALAEDGYRRSQEKQEQTHRRARPITDQQGKETLSILEVNITTEQFPGDPRFLKIIIECIQQRRDILGLDAPKRTELTGANGGPIELELALMTPDQRAIRHAELKTKIEAEAEKRVMARLQVGQEEQIPSKPTVAHAEFEIVESKP